MSRFLAAAVMVLLGFGPAAAQQAGGPPPVTVATPLAREVVDWSEFTGRFAAIESVEVRARVSGTLTEVHFADGQMVKKGELLFVIDPRPFEIALESAKAKLAQAEAQLDLARRQLTRAGPLRKNDVIAPSAYDQRVQDQRTAEAAVLSAQAAIHDAELNLAFSHVEAPISGRIGARAIDAGNLVTGGGGTGGSGSSSPTLLATIVALDPINLDFDLSESDYLALRKALRAGGLTAQVHLADEAQWSRRGRLDFVDNRLDPGSGTIRARVVVDNPDLAITPGEFARIRLPASPPYEALTVPDAAVLTDQSERMVMTVGPDGTVIPKRVEPGPVVDGLRVIRSGLAPDDKVVIDGLMRARPGAKVTAQAGRIEPQQARAE
ncbi:MAG: efflux RND transporter periplasmic adaptor subunit [Actinomycetota bacterium]